MVNIISEIKTFVRDINLTLLSSSKKIDIDISKRYHKKIRLFMPNRKLINYVTQTGGVLTGSRALRCFKIDGKQMFDRHTHDWDFVVTSEMAFNICNKFDISIIPGVDKVISIKGQRHWRHPAYSDSYRVGPVDVQLIVKDELPGYKEVKGVRIANFGYTIAQKSIMIDEMIEEKGGTWRVGDELNKHIEDMTQLIIKFNCL
jgi:hypothetical protein